LSLRRLRIGTFVASPSPDPDHPYWPIATASMDTSVFDVVHMFSERSISAVPIVDDDGVVLNLYETVDVIVRPNPKFLFPSLTGSLDSRSLGCISDS